MSAEKTVLTITIFSNKKIADFNMLGEDIITNALLEIKNKPVDVLSINRSKGKGTFKNETMITKVEMMI